MAVPQSAIGDKPNLLGMTLPEMTAFFAAMGEKPFRAKQVFRWIHHGGVDNFDAMTDRRKSR
jgi:23S rRNA (adenine2503-C2)-methyltransferase